ncbi:MAG: type II toxin-antitoxin system RelE/ParE family toxin [Terriglobia bacterium]
MNYLLFILPRAQKELAQLSSAAYPRVRDAIRELAENPRPPGCLKLTGRDGWRLRVGDFRVVYEIDDKQRKVTVFHIGHRRDVYR